MPLHLTLTRMDSRQPRSTTTNEKFQNTAVHPCLRRTLPLNTSRYQEYWRTTSPILPERSYLYPLNPIALGTPFVESFTSYIARLAATHQVTTGILLAQEVAPLINRCKQSYRLSNNFFSTFLSQTGAWNGTGIMAAEPVSVLQKLTKQPTLRFLTLLTWAEVLTTRNLLRPYKAWCPLCYFEYEQNGIPIHEPLAWSISTVTTCLQHRLPLLYLCPHCGETIYHLSWNTNLGFCCRCHNWLGNSCHLDNSQLITDSDWQWQLFVGQQIGDILANAPYLMQTPQKQNLAHAIDLCITFYSGGKAKIFADLMFLSPTVPSDWRSGRALPVLNLLLRVCYRLSMTLRDLLTGNVDITRKEVLKELPLCQQRYKTNRPFDLIKIKQLLETALSQFPPQSLRQVASTIEYDRTELYRHLPDLCHQINLRYKLYKNHPESFNV
jgi:hypothetical protein